MAWINIRTTLKPTAATVETIYTWTGADTLSIIWANNSTDSAIWVYIVPKNWTAWADNCIVPWLVLKATETKVLLSWVTILLEDTIQVKSTSGNVTFFIMWDK